ncbi:MAG: hypothetical protein A2075_02160 [Geobacteraceae bacterium GWC2_58_44]|nr:MAG: hypothetical protein A2075_02160 [Geobacteraceae bacterium GWC2_58_44]HBG05847.1 hypothetical protein [Geobacter sp.]
MATPGEKLAASLEVLQRVQRGKVLRSSSLSRMHRERLLQNENPLCLLLGERWDASRLRSFSSYDVPS